MSNVEQPLPTALKQSLPNWLTISRVVVVFPVIGLLAIHTPACYGVALVLSLYAAATDFLDGYLSRRWDVMSDLGRLLDPIADKLLVAVLLIMLSAQGYGSPIAVSLIMFREIFISGLREFMQEHRIVIHVTILAKYKTALQMLACLTLLGSGTLPDVTWLRDSAEWMVWFATGLTLWTGCDYIIRALRLIPSKDTHTS